MYADMRKEAERKSRIELILSELLIAEESLYADLVDGEGMTEADFNELLAEALKAGIEEIQRRAK